MSIFSTPSQLEEMRRMLVNYAKLPFAQGSIPGALMESVLAYVRGGEVLNTYDFVDVISVESGRGWQVKSTKAETPVTWKRAKIPNAAELIIASEESSQGLQELGDAIIEFCNGHARASLQKYGLKEIGYARLILQKTGDAMYFERLLCSEDSPDIFDPADFVWQWSEPKSTQAKEQLPALHGTNLASGDKWWAWHGRGENQLHFSKENVWWPDANDSHAINFRLPMSEEKLSFRQLADLLATLDA